MPRALTRAALGAAILASLLMAPAALSNWDRFLGNWLVLFVFVVTLGLGALFLVALEFLVNATWSVPFRRISENLAGLILISLPLAIPILMGLHTLYEWTHSEAVSVDSILRAKAPYLNLRFFLIRFALFYLVWIGAYFLFVGGSRRQDSTGDVGLTKRAMKLAPPFMILLAFTLTFAAFDWIMSLAPYWYSSIFGIYLLTGAMVAGTAIITFAGASLKLKNLLPEAVRSDHFYNLGALLFALNTLWAYIAFAQYLLIWYGGIPVETHWFDLRSQRGWEWVSVLLVLAHFLVPFLALLSRSAKTDLRRLRWVSAWILGAHGLDLYWLIMPSVRVNEGPFGWQDLCFPIAAIALALSVWLWQSARFPVIAIRDPRLQAGLQFHL
jgi:hypothetical protein